MTINRSMLSLIGFTILLYACKKDSDDPPAPPVNQEELITSLYMYFTPDGGGDTAALSFVDLDGGGGNAPVIIGDTLPQATTFDAWIQVLNEVDHDTITYEIEDEAEAHQFFFTENGGTLAFISYDDADANGNPIGLLSTWQSAAATNGTITITLRHQPDKFAAGVSAGDITNAGGGTDIEVTLPYVVQ